MNAVETGAPRAISSSMAKLWTRFHGDFLLRLDVIDAAVLALGAGRLEEESRVAASQAAHKLAGVLGTFGLSEGTELARETELALNEPLGREEAAVMAKRQARLRAMIEQRG